MRNAAMRNAPDREATAPERNLTIAEKCAAVSRREAAQIAKQSSARAKRSGPKAPRAGAMRNGAFRARVPLGRWTAHADWHPAQASHTAPYECKNAQLMPPVRSHAIH